MVDYKPNKARESSLLEWTDKKHIGLILLIVFLVIAVTVFVASTEISRDIKRDAKFTILERSVISLVQTTDDMVGTALSTQKVQRHYVSELHSLIRSQNKSIQELLDIDSLRQDDANVLLAYGNALLRFEIALNNVQEVSDLDRLVDARRHVQNVWNLNEFSPIR